MGEIKGISKIQCILLACCCIVYSTSAADITNSNDKSEKDSGKSSSLKTQNVWTTAPTKIALKRETLPIPGSKSALGGKSTESLRTASQTLFGYNGNSNGYTNGFGGNQFGGFGGFSPSYTGGNANGYNQYSQLGNAYNVLGQNHQGMFGTQGQNPYYTNGFFGGGAAYNSYPFATNSGYQFGNPQGGFGFGGFNNGFNSGFFPGAQYQGQVGNRNFGFINQGFGNPAFRNPQNGVGISTSSGITSIPSQVQVGTGLEVGSRGFSSSHGGFPSASGQQYIVGNGIGQPAFIGGIMDATGGFGGFGNFGTPHGGGGLYLPRGGIPGGLYRQPGHNSIFGPYDYPRALTGSPSPSTIAAARPSSGATRLQSSGPNRYYSSTGAYSPNSNSRERLYRYTISNES